MRSAIALLLALLALGCSGTKETRKAAREGRRCERYVNKHPKCFLADTVHDTIRVVIPREGFDSLLYVEIHDTVRVDSGRVRVVLVRGATGTPCDTLRIPFYVKADCDSAVKEVPVTTICPPRPKCPEPGVPDRWRTMALVLAGVVALLGLLLARR